MIKANRTKNNMQQISAMLLAVACLSGLAAANVCRGQTFSVLRSFNAINGSGINFGGVYPSAGLVFSGTTLYGTAPQGGSSDSGTLFKVNADGTGFSVIKNFSAASSGTNRDGAYPNGTLALSGNTLYGTATGGGSSGYGTAFKVYTDGTGFTVLHNFIDSGAEPQGGLVPSGGTLYGTTSGGGMRGSGTVFKVNTDGTGYTLLWSFSQAIADGSNNQTNSEGVGPSGGLVLSGSILYGTAAGGGTRGKGTVFKVNTDGTGFGVLKNFTGSDGADPRARLVLSGNALFGTTYGDNISYGGTVFKVNTDGTGFSVLKTFTAGVAGPSGGLALSGSKLYGTTVNGGTPGNGRVFQLNTDGTGYTVLHNFDYTTGAVPRGDLLLSGGALYGTTFYGGNTSIDPSGYGTVWVWRPIPLNFQILPGYLILSWTNAGYSLQSAPEAGGTYTNISGATSPYIRATTGNSGFFRLNSN
jgi:uncharacterized repeat protein (TIGR03803 family)